MFIQISDIKLIFAIVAFLLTFFLAFLPYIRDILKNKTKPHIYTWFIWTITQGVATVSLFYGKGSWGALNLLISTFFVFIIFFLSLKYGTKNITKSDVIVLIIALLTIIIWIQVRSLLLAVFMVSVIDFMAYLPSFRKTFQEPWTETVSTWFVSTLGYMLIIFSLSEYNLLTLTYLITIIFANMIMVFICLTRRNILKNRA
jgi:hypothetical protein